MRKKAFSIALSLISAHTFSYAQLTPKAKQKFQNSIQKHLNGFMDTLRFNAHEMMIGDTLALPEIQENLTDMDSSDENVGIIKRLDSLEQEVPLTHNQYVQQYIDIYASRKTFIGNMLSLGTYYFPIFEEALKESEVPLEIKYLPVIESALNPTATSRMGAKGIWQFMHATAKAYGLHINNYVDERKDPELASKAAATYLKEAYDEFGDWLLAIASYNCGLGNVRKALSKSGGVYDFWAIRPYLPRETRNYVPAFIAATYMMQCYKSHGIEPSIVADIYQNNEQIYLSNPVNLDRLAKNLSIKPEQLYLLNPAYSRHIINASINEPKAVILPSSACINRSAVFNALNDGGNCGSLRIIEEMDSKVYQRNSTKGKPITVIVRKGQALSTIAQNNGVSLGQLKSWNNIRKSSKIYVGQKLKIYTNNRNNSRAVKANASLPFGKKYYSYKVKKGDTLPKIAASKGVSVAALKKVNGIVSTQSIKPGMILKVHKM